MTRTLNVPMRIALAAIIFATAAAASCAAQGPGGPPGGGMGGPGFPGGGPGMQRLPQAEPGGEAHGGLELGPPGRWWDDRQFAAAVRIRPEQRMRMDAIFDQNRSILLARLDGVRQAEAQMHELAKSTMPDEAALFAQIDRISQARADLEKATTHTMLMIRREMDPGQIRLLEQQMQR